MRAKAASRATRLLISALRKHGFALRLAGCFFSVALATVFVGLAPEANLIWVANGVMLAYLLLAPRHRWAAYLGAGYVAQFTAGLLIGHHGVVSGLILTFLNLAESLISAALLRRRSSDLPDFTSPAYITRFFLFGVLAGPAITGAADALLSPLWHFGSPLWHAPSPLLHAASPLCTLRQSAPSFCNGLPPTRSEPALSLRPASPSSALVCGNRSSLSNIGPTSFRLWLSRT